MRESRTRVNGERVFAGAIGVVFAAQFLMALRYPPDPRLFPLLVAVAGFLLCVILLVGIGLHGPEEKAPEPLPRGLLLLTLAVSPIYGFGLWFLGYWVATLIVIPTVAWLLGYRRTGPLAATTVLVTIALGVIFPLLGVPLPHGILPELIGL